MTIMLLLAIWILCGCAAMKIGQERGHGAAGSFWCGALLGLLGVLLVSVIRPPVEVPDELRRSFAFDDEADRG
ncbi:hypothetical protein SEA_NAIRB_32 [Mycobacterium phage Nairb]|nr:membrane protein [Mycobacterium phage Bernal13]AHY26948.1 hypothetical protein PBI_BERNAL13_32 [Mycobacterium phage Bernal13]AVO21820.1 hypothetical protein SEA_NAIRB_32 [Mycobacterium phage Nairb]QBP28877.1 hypothetical protein SEA_IBRAHIM_32 [Mycobacterium phage Ibrahim]QHB47438.1 hypothetical protein SEA_WHITTY_32 [Mycobacterium phage Whitty]